MQSKLSRPPISAWQVESFRLTAFPISVAPANEVSWWSDVVGEPAETRTTQSKTGVVTEEGLFQNGRLVEQIRPDRVDWRFLAVPKNDLPELFSTLGEFPQTLDAFLGLALKWLNLRTCPELRRLAFGSVLFLPASSKQEGYRQIEAFLPFNLDVEHSSDFSYQINRPRKSSSANASLVINRLSKWSVAAVFAGSLSMVPKPALYPTGERYFCRLELDINTQQDRQTGLPQHELGQIFKELVVIGREITEKGDIA